MTLFFVLTSLHRILIAVQPDVTGTIAVGLDQDGTCGGVTAGATVIDGVVVGMSYSTSSGITGATDFDGTFKYGLGDTVTFSIGSVVVGSISADQRDGRWQAFPARDRRRRP